MVDPLHRPRKTIAGWSGIGPAPSPARVMFAGKDAEAEPEARSCIVCLTPLPSMARTDCPAVFGNVPSTVAGRSGRVHVPGLPVWSAQRHAAHLGRRQSGLGAGGDHLAFVLGD